MKQKEAEEKRKFPLELRLKEKIIGQQAAIATVASGKNITNPGNLLSLDKLRLNSAENLTLSKSYFF